MSQMHLLLHGYKAALFCRIRISIMSRKGYSQLNWRAFALAVAVGQAPSIVALDVRYTVLAVPARAIP